jgi:S-formylglutathione hydrolase FrmB
MMACAVAAVWMAGAVMAQTGTVERIKVHAKSLEGNLSGDSADRDVSVYLPPSYQKDKKRRYPVVYMLHGFTDSDEKWFGFTKHWINLPEVLNKSLAGGAKEMIVVMPNAYTRFAGSMYSRSVTVGDWDEFVSRELVAYVDAHYRTLARRESRGLAGHSMGGYGTLRVGMNHPDVYASMYALNPCCLEANLDPSGAARVAKVESVRSDEEIRQADFMTKAMLASAAAWSPNPKNPPFFVDLPTKEGKWQAPVAAKWAANAPLSMIDQNVFHLKKFRAIGFDAGTQEGTITTTTKALHDALERYGVAHAFEIYEGNHINRVAERIEKKVMPFFSETLDTGNGK